MTASVRLNNLIENEVGNSHKFLAIVTTPGQYLSPRFGQKFTKIGLGWAGYKIRIYWPAAASSAAWASWCEARSNKRLGAEALKVCRGQVPVPLAVLTEDEAVFKLSQTFTPLAKNKYLAIVEGPHLKLSKFSARDQSLTMRTHCLLM